jgi:hypothetical protein
MNMIEWLGTVQRKEEMLSQLGLALKLRGNK